ncbi:MAG: PTS sugar transporter subunit IIA [Phycisphaerales bacterium]|nr:MAG: PTS sugar transporter subunit IIA [Phycisphaerales bacterium]
MIYADISKAFIKVHFVDRALFCPHIQARSIVEVYQQIVDCFYEKEGLGYDEKQIIMNILLERESQITTYMGNGVALPHITVTQTPAIANKIGWFRCPEGIDTRSGKRRTIRVFLCIVASGGLSVLTGIGLEIVRQGALVEALMNASTVGDMKRVIVKGIEQISL